MTKFWFVVKISVLKMVSSNVLNVCVWYGHFSNNMRRVTLKKMVQLYNPCGEIKLLLKACKGSYKGQLLCHFGSGNICRGGASKNITIPSPTENINLASALKNTIIIGVSANYNIDIFSGTLPLQYFLRYLVK